MKTFKVLAGGWLVGGAIIVLLSAITGLGLGGAVDSGVLVPVAQASAGEAETASAAAPAKRYAAGAITIPVSGITPADLRDTFHEKRSGGRVHRAIDILAPRGTPVVAAVDGPLRKLFNSGAGGLTIYQFDEKAQRVYYYAHLDRYAAGVTENLFVRGGTVIGYVGTTGNAPPGTPHLHFSIEDLPPGGEWWKGEPVNPFPILSAAVAR